MTEDTSSRVPRADRFAIWLAALAALGLGVRLGYVYAHANNALSGDPFAYHRGANLLVHGRGFIVPLLFEFGHTVQAADHPPAYTLFLAILSSTGLQTQLAHLIWSAFLGTGTVVLAGVLGRRVGGNHIGLITAALVALAPNIWVYDGDLLSETLAIFVSTLAVYLAYRAWDRPSGGRICALGAACGAAALSRSELLLLVPALLWPVSVFAARASARVLIIRVAMGTAVALIVIAPWIVYNLTRFDHPVFLSSQLEATLAGANCADTYSGNGLGTISSTCLSGVDRFADQSVTEEELRPRIWRFVSANASRIPTVVAARVGRVTGLYRPRQQLDLDAVLEGRERPVATAGLMNSYLFELGAIAGCFLWRRRGVPRFPLLVLPAITVFTIALTYGTNRFRASAEVSLAVLTAVAIGAMWERATTKHREAAVA